MGGDTSHAPHKLLINNRPEPSPAAFATYTITNNDINDTFVSNNQAKNNGRLIQNSIIIYSFHLNT